MNECIYLNHAGVGPLSAPAVEAIRRALEENLRDGPRIDRWIAAAEACRALVAELLNARSESVAFLQNTAQAISTIARGIGLTAGDQVIVPSVEYPANVYPWLALAEQGIETMFIEPNALGELTIERFEAAFTDKTRLVAVSFVQFGNGFRIDCAELAAACHRKGILLLVDAVQGLGAMPLDATESGIDFAAAGSHKWLLSPPGIGALYVAPHLIESVQPTMVGALNVENPLAFDTIDYRLSASARRFESGTANFLGFIGMEQSLRLLLETGVDTIASGILDLIQWSRMRLREAGFAVHSPDNDRHASGILSFSLPGAGSAGLVEKLRMAGITASLRKNRVRISPHWYNTREQIQRCIDVLTT